MIKSFGMTVKVDEIGRIQIPFEIREKVNFIEKDKIYVYIKNNMIVLEKYQDKNQINGIVRRMDELGKVVLPIEIRKQLKIEENDELEIGIEDNTIILNMMHHIL